MRLEGELRDASGYGNQPEEFAALIRILDAELRLITPIDQDDLISRDEPAGSDGAGTAGVRHYQLTHDYLVRPLRDWLTRKQRETSKGRAELILEERASFWSAKPEKRYLPSIGEWARIRLLTDTKAWSPRQRAMMSAAAKRYWGRIARTGFLIALAATALAAAAAWVEHGRRRHEVSSFVENLRVADWALLPDILSRFGPGKGLLWDEVTRIARDPSRSAEMRLRARLAVAPFDFGVAAGLTEDLAAASPQQVRIISGRLDRWKSRLLPRLWSALADPGLSLEATRRFACALAHIDPRSSQWTDVAGHVADAVLDEKDPILFTGWIEQLEPVRRVLVDPLARACVDPLRSEEERLLTTGALVELGREQPDRVAEVLLAGNDRHGEILNRPVLGDPERFGSLMRAELAKGDKAVSDALGTSRAANAALTLARLGQWDPIWPLLRQSPNPALRTQLVHRLHRAAASPTSLFDRLRVERDPSARQAILLALGGYQEERLPEKERAALRQECHRLYVVDPDAGVHSAAEWILRKSGQNSELAELQEKLRGKPATGNWLIQKDGITMVIFSGPVTFEMGSPTSERRRDDAEVRHARLIPRGFALSAHEVTIEQFQKFDPQYGGDPHVAPQPDSPATRISWFDAARFCRWLTSQEGWDESDQCYPENIGPDMKLPENFWARKGYRLPTDAEWEYACRAGSTTRWFFGEDDSMLINYGWFSMNADDYLWPVGLLKPNPWGLFDVYGNCLEWCQNAAQKIDEAMAANVVRDDEFGADVHESRVLRGGGYTHPPRETRSAKQFKLDPEARLSFPGLRVARTVF
jgi:formylglycine-generating enzyme required for sulfatase activity